MKREPVLTASVVVGVVMGFITMAVSLGWFKLGGEQLDNIESFVVALVPLLLTLAGGYWARSQVTPVAAPRDNSGNELVPKQ